MIGQREQLQCNADRVRERVAAATARVGSREKVRIVPATKCVPREVVAMLPAVGICEAGENRVQEFVQKCDLPLGWHFIGALQTNKVKALIGKTVLVQSVDRTSLVDALQKQSAAHDCVTDVLIEVNVGGEQTKSGVLPEKLDELAHYAAAQHNLRVHGLMSVLPKCAPAALYERMRALYEKLQTTFGYSVLSMGMSDDYELAVASGANLIRPGRALFGAR